MKQKTKKESAFSCLGLMLLMVFFTLSAFNSQAQNKISGIVKDEAGLALPGVNIVQKGTKNGVVTDIDGKYAITLAPGIKILVFSFMGLEVKEVTIGANKTIDVTLKEDIDSLSEVVVIGYTTVNREKVLGAVTSLKSESLEQATPVSVFDAAQGKIAGVQILTNGGPGAGFDIRIRGVSTFGSGVNPLYVVDGQQLDDIDNINPDDIESLEVLKDGATAAIYGSKAANGVVLITTKKGKSGPFSVSISNVTGFNSLVGDIRIANTRQRYDYDVTRGLAADSLNLLRGNSFNLQKLVTRVATRIQTNVALQGGNDKVKFYWNNSITKNQGIVINSDFYRLTSNFNTDLEVSKKFTLGTKVNLTYDESNGLDEGQVFRQLVQRRAFFPIYEPDGSFVGEFQGVQNPLAEATATNRNRNYRGQMFSYAQLEILPKLTIKSTLGINYQSNKRNYFNPIITVNPLLPFPVGRETFVTQYDIQQENFLNYKNRWSKHNFGAYGGMQIQQWTREAFDIRANFNNEYVQTFNNSDPTNITIFGGTDNSIHSLYSLFGGFNYDFNNKYLLSGSIRRDGSSRFGESNKFGNFPSLSIGWKINKESFFKGLEIINNLMFRASYGVVGNERIPNYEFAGALDPGFNYNGLGGIASTRLGNDLLRWEKTASSNLGLDLGMFKNRLTVNVDVWEKITTDLLAYVPLPEESGFNQIRKNVGAVNNKGIDLTVGGTIIKSKNFSWQTSFNISYQENKVTKLDGGIPFLTGNYKIEEGQPIGNIFGYKNLGVFPYTESNAYNDEGVRLTPNFDTTTGSFVNYTLDGTEYTGTVNKMRVNGTTVVGGDIIWEDLDGDLNITEADRQTIGNGLPKYFGGFNNTLKYKGFMFAFSFDYNFGNQLYRAWDENRNDLNTGGETPGPDRIEGAWRNEGDVTVFPRLRNSIPNRLVPNSYFVTSGDYIKLRYVRLIYSLPQSMLKNVKAIKSLAVSLAVNNVLTWTNYLGWNPEMGNRGNPLTPGQDDLRYPNDRQILLGVKVNL